MNQGTCPICGRTVRLRLSDSMLRRHGFSLPGRGGISRDGQCAGTGKPPQPPQPDTNPRRTP